MKLEHSRQIFEEPSDVKFRENPSSGSRVVPCEGTERGRYDEANSHFSLFCERALKIRHLRLPVFSKLLLC